MATEHIFVAYNSRPTKGKPYFAIGSIHWCAQGARDFMGGSAEWRKLSRAGWRIIKYRLPEPKRNKLSGAVQ